MKSFIKTKSINLVFTRRQLSGRWKKLTEARNAITEVSGRQLDERWSPIQILEDGRLKNYKFISIDTEERRIAYEDSAGEMRKIRYDNGSIKLDWRPDWPGRWWLMGVAIEPFGRAENW